MKIALGIAAALAGVIVIVTVIGYMLPVAHTATRERMLPADPAAVFAVIATPADFPRWRRDVKRVEVLPPVDGKPSFREIGGDGEITYIHEEVLPGRRLVSRIADRSLPFGGSWTYELGAAPGGSGTLLRVTENGEVYNPVFRFMSRFVLGHTYTMDRYLADLDARLASGARP